jgi:hypothetical protein
MARLTRKLVAETLESVPIDQILVGASRGTPKSLTAKQKRFAEAIARGETKAGAYREAYNTNTRPEIQSNEGARLCANPRVALQIEAFRVAAEAKRYATPAALRSLVIEQLTQIAIDPDVKDAQRLRALELLGKVTEVAAFTERRELVKVTESGDARTRLVDSLRQALAVVDVQAIEPDLLAELKPDTNEPGDADGEGLVDSAGETQGEGATP